MAAEILGGVALLLGVWPRYVALALVALFLLGDGPFALRPSPNWF